MSQSPQLAAAINAARAAEKVILNHYQTSIKVELKSDFSPVTVADVEAEKAIKAVLVEEFPDYGFYGEETGRDRADAEYTWLVDPIDGTKCFIRQRPFFSTQIALYRNGEVVLGVSNSPAYGEFAYAERGCGAFLNDAPIRVSDTSDIGQVILSTGNIKTLTHDHRWQALGELIRKVNGVRGYGDFLHYHLLAAGKLDLVIESDVNILDVAALSVIVEEAGGRVTDLSGGPLNLDTTDIVASNGPLHDFVLETLS